MPPHPLTNFDIQNYYQNEPRFNSVYSRNNLPEKVKDGAYVTNLDEYADVGIRWIAYFVTKVKLFNSIVLMLTMFLKKLKNLSGIKTLSSTSKTFNNLLVLLCWIH